MWCWTRIGRRRLMGLGRLILTTPSSSRNPTSCASQRKRCWSSAACRTRKPAARSSCDTSGRAMFVLIGRSRPRVPRTMQACKSSCKDHSTLALGWPKRCRIRSTSLLRLTMTESFEATCSSQTTTSTKWLRPCCQRRWSTRRRRTFGSLNCKWFIIQRVLSSLALGTWNYFFTYWYLFMDYYTIGGPSMTSHGKAG